MAGKAQTQIGRLAFREEGEFWNAYWAPYMDSMSGAVLLASIRFSAMRDNPAIKDSFMALAKTAFATVIKDITGRTPTWAEAQPAPENERVVATTGGGKRGN
jgi:hypothetical protein